jgi:hypothetical protein
LQWHASAACCHCSISLLVSTLNFNQTASHLLWCHLVGNSINLSVFALMSIDEHTSCAMQCIYCCKPHTALHRRQGLVNMNVAAATAAGQTSTVLVKLSSDICDDSTGAVAEEALAAAVQQAAAQGLSNPQPLPTRCWYALQQQQEQQQQLSGGAGRMVGVASLAAVSGGLHRHHVSAVTLLLLRKSAYLISKALCCARLATLAL